MLHESVHELQLTMVHHRFRWQTTLTSHTSVAVQQQDAQRVVEPSRHQLLTLMSRHRRQQAATRRVRRIAFLYREQNSHRQ